MRYRLVLWDFDGTLADTGADVWASLSYAAARCGARPEEGFMADDANLSASVADIFRHLIPFPGEAVYPAFDADVSTHYRTVNDFAHTRLYPGVVRLVGTLRRRRARNVIVTNKPRQALERLLLVKGWASLFDGWITPDYFDGDMSKTDMIAAMIGRYGVGPQACVYIGDTWSDIQAAHANGIDGIAVTYGDGDVAGLRAQHPRYCVDNLDEVAAVLLDGAPAASMKEGTMGR